MCGGGGMPAIQPAPATPKPADPAVQEAMKKERELALKRKGRQSTILTPLTNESDSAAKTTLG